MFVSYLFYFLCFLICVVLAYLSDKYHSKTILLLLIFFISSVVGLRGYEVGIDTISYVEKWEDVLHGKPAYIEFGFRFLMVLLQNITSNPTILLFVCALITYSCFILRLWDFREKASFTLMVTLLFMLVFALSMNVMRQYCAIAIVFYGSRFLFEKKNFLFLVYVLLASTIHYSALLALCFFAVGILRWRTLKSRQKLLYLLLILLGLILATYMVPLFISEYGQYFENEKSDVGLLVWAKLFFIIGSAMMSGLFRKKSINNDDRYIIRVIFLLYLFGTALESLGYFFPFVYRVGFQFSIFGILYWSFLFRNTKDISLNIIYIIALLLLLGVPFVINFEGQGVLPYYFLT